MNSIQDLDRAIGLWFEEDIREGDHTTLSTIPKEASGRAVLHVKQDGIIAGIAVAERVFQCFDPEVVVSTQMSDGDPISVGDRVLEVEGSVHTILQCERLVLNIMQRMSGIATSTREYVDLLEGTGTRILDTRKTTPGFRLLEKEAVRLGGGVNHRIGLFDMILIKDNHIDFAGGIDQAINGAGKYQQERSLNLPVVIETRSLKDVEEVLRIGKINRIMLDNFSTGMTREAVTLIDGRYETESSGGITRETIRAYAECGVDYISVGALTHQVKSLDLSLKADY
ncbi:MAG: carboxylating nicotinate-nucleotide diphosphorylase [Bacteroidetes bacterium]|nr:carboxylating nicotinate-nucleotide diphosphorylase [Bacteroidota bacterium]